MKSTMEQQAALIKELDEELDAMDKEMFWHKLVILALVIALIYIGLR